MPRNPRWKEREITLPAPQRNKIRNVLNRMKQGYDRKDRVLKYTAYKDDKADQNMVTIAGKMARGNRVIRKHLPLPVGRDLSEESLEMVVADIHRMLAIAEQMESTDWYSSLSEEDEDDES